MPPEQNTVPARNPAVTFAWAGAWLIATGLAIGLSTATGSGYLEDESVIAAHAGAFAVIIPILTGVTTVVVSVGAILRMAPWNEYFEATTASERREVDDARLAESSGRPTLVIGIAVLALWLALLGFSIFEVGRASGGAAYFGIALALWLLAMIWGECFWLSHTIRGARRRLRESMATGDA